MHLLVYNMINHTPKQEIIIDLHYKCEIKGNGLAENVKNFRIFTKIENIQNEPGTLYK